MAERSNAYAWKAALFLFRKKKCSDPKKKRDRYTNKRIPSQEPEFKSRPLRYYFFLKKILAINVIMIERTKETKILVNPIKARTLIDGFEFSKYKG